MGQASKSSQMTSSPSAVTVLPATQQGTGRTMSGVLVTLSPQGPGEFESPGLGTSASCSDGREIALAELSAEAHAFRFQSLELEGRIDELNEEVRELRMKWEAVSDNEPAADIEKRLRLLIREAETVKERRREALESLLQEYIKFHENEVAEEERAELEDSKRVADGYNAGPTGCIRSLRTAFGPMKKETEVQQHGKICRVAFKYDGLAKAIPLKLVLPPGNNGLWQNSKELSKVLEVVHHEVLTPTGLKVLFGLFKLLDDNFRQYEVPFYVDPFLDSLAFARGSNGYHYTANVRTVSRVLSVYSHIEVTGKIVLGYKRGKPVTEVRTEPVLQVVGGRQIWLGDPDVIDTPGKKLFDGATLRISPVIYADVRKPPEAGGGLGNMYTWYSERWLKEDARISRHGYTVLLIPYFADKWRLQWRRHGAVYTCNLRAVLRDTGIPVDMRHAGEKIVKIKSELEYMLEQGYIGDWELRPDKSRKDLDRILEVTAPDDYPLRFFTSTT